MNAWFTISSRGMPVTGLLGSNTDTDIDADGYGHPHRGRENCDLGPLKTDVQRGVPCRRASRFTSDVAAA